MNDTKNAHRHKKRTTPSLRSKHHHGRRTPRYDCRRNPLPPAVSLPPPPEPPRSRHPLPPSPPPPLPPSPGQLSGSGLDKELLALETFSAASSLGLGSPTLTTAVAKFDLPVRVLGYQGVVHCRHYSRLSLLDVSLILLSPLRFNSFYYYSEDCLRLLWPRCHVLQQSQSDCG